MPSPLETIIAGAAQACTAEFDESKQRLVVKSVLGNTMEDSPACMAAVVDKLAEIKRIPRLVASAEAREYEYTYEESKMLYEIADVILQIRAKEIITLPNIYITPEFEYFLPARFGLLERLVQELRSDPWLAYRKLVREFRSIRLKAKKLQQGTFIPELESGVDPRYLIDGFSHYLTNALLPIKKLLDSTMLIQTAKQLYQKAEMRRALLSRDFYRRLFHPTTRPTFMYTRFALAPPAGAELLERYKVREVQVSIYRVPGSVRRLYHLVPPEFALRDEDYSLLDEARRLLGAHEPAGEEVSEPERFRENIFNISLDLLRDITRAQGIQATEEHLRRLADVLARYTAGLGILELFLADEKIQDVLVNAPIGTVPVYIMHADYEECETNIFPSNEDGESWATRFRLQSGRPLDEANPVLDTELIVPGGRARVAAITKPLSPDGIAFAFRRFRDRPWTFPLFIKAKMLDAFAAGLIWFLVDGARTILVAGTRGSGKTSFTGSMMVQIMPKTRIIVTEDTLELPVTQLREIGYNVQRLKSRSVITHVETELPAEEALRTALRLGDSALILGEVRSKEAIALYEAMRIGALANVVAGTIHGESAYGVFDRVVHDLGVPPTSFKATDIILIANVLRSPDGLHAYRRITEITEVRKHWKDDPGLEGGFVPLMEYNAKEDMLKPTQTLLMGESQILNDIANRVKDWRANWPAVWDNINLRAKIMQALVDLGNKNAALLESDFMMKSNSQFHTISDEVKREVGALDSKMIFEKWLRWAESQL